MNVLLLYKNIKSKRKELGLSQEELAKLTGYTDRTSISKIEAGKVNLSQTKIVEFAKVLGTTPGDLMGWEVERVEDGYLANENGNKYRAILRDVTKDVSDEELIEIIKYAKYLLKDQK